VISGGICIHDHFFDHVWLNWFVARWAFGEFGAQ
jgi:hypothetical protein